MVRCWKVHVLKPEAGTLRAVAMALVALSIRGTGKGEPGMPEIDFNSKNVFYYVMLRGPHSGLLLLFLAASNIPYF